MKSEFALKPASVFSRGAATECSPGRQPGVGVVLEISPGGAKDSEDSFAPPGPRSYRKKTPGSRPGLHSVAAPRLAIAAYFGHFSLRDEGWLHEPDHPVRAIMPPFQGGKSVASVAH